MNVSQGRAGEGSPSEDPHPPLPALDSSDRADASAAIQCIPYLGAIGFSSDWVAIILPLLRGYPMQQQRLKAYLDLIQELLTCPHGEEWIRLRKHEDLVNPELVQVMEQVAAQLARQGDGASARFIHNWAGQLHHILAAPPPVPSEAEDRTQAYLDLIQALLDTPTATQQILENQRNLLGPALVQTMQEVATNLAVQGNQEAAEFLQSVAATVNRSWMAAHGFSPRWQKPDPAMPGASAPTPSAASPPVSPPAPSPAGASQPEPLMPVPDPWGLPEPPSEPAIVAIASPPPPVAPAAAASPPAGQADWAQSLATLTTALQELTAALKNRPQGSHALWYLEALEKAAAHGWILSTEEVETLIGIKPHCGAGEQVFQRGSWEFVKVGRMGAQTGWQAMKRTVNGVAAVSG